MMDLLKRAKQKYAKEFGHSKDKHPVEKSVNSALENSTELREREKRKAAREKRHKAEEQKRKDSLKDLEEHITHLETNKEETRGDGKISGRDFADDQEIEGGGWI